MPKKYVVRLSAEECSQIERLVRRGRAHARKLLYGRILLKADADGPECWTEERIAEAFEVSTATVARERRRYCEDGLEVEVMPKKPGKTEEKGSGWASRGSSDRPLVLGSAGGHGALEHEVVGRSDGRARARGVGVLRDRKAHAQKNCLKPHLKRQWVIPPRKSAAFVWRMEEVLDLYEQPYGPLQPVVCFDERPCQLIGEVRGTFADEARPHRALRFGVRARRRLLGTHEL